MIRGPIHSRVRTSDDRQEVDNQNSEIRRPPGRPRLYLDHARIVDLRDGAQLSWRIIAKQLRAGATTVRRAYRDAKRLGDVAAPNSDGDCSTTEGSTQEESV
jgi:DNA invertase Pin-like site-specific DNA recombinase